MKAGVVVRTTGAFLVAVAVLVGPWIGRNLNDFSRTEIVSANLGSVIAGANCPITYYGPLMGAWSATCTNSVRQPRGDASVDDYRLRSVGERYASKHAGRAVVVALVRLGRAVGVWPDPANQVSWNATAGGVWPLWSSWVYWIAWIGSIPLAVIGGRGMGRRRETAWPLYVLLFLFLANSVILYADPRFASSFQPALAILVGVGVVDVLTARLSPRVARAGGGTPPRRRPPSHARRRGT